MPNNPNVTFEHPPMKTTAELLARYGNPTINQKLFEKNWMVLWDNPYHLQIPHLPAKIYVNKDITVRLEKTLAALILANVHNEIKSFDGCFVVRSQRGSSSISRHSFGIALDINAAWNPLYGKITWSEQFLNIWRNNGWICGADFHSRKDGMHFEQTAASSW